MCRGGSVAEARVAGAAKIEALRAIFCHAFHFAVITLPPFFFDSLITDVTTAVYTDFTRAIDLALRQYAQSGGQRGR